MAYRKEAKDSIKFSRISVSLASPDEILERSYGEVTKPETINYRTYKPERDGLFCEKIFGPVKDYECHCGKYKRLRYKGIVCDRCGVEVTEKKVRRERTGHISLVVPVTHIWYARSTPNKLGHLLGIKAKKLESIIYYEKYVVINPGPTNLEKLDLLSEEEYFEVLDNLEANSETKDNQLKDDSDPEKFVAAMGAPALEQLLLQIDLDALSYELRDKAENETSQQRKAEALKRLQVVEAFRESKGRSKPEWMVLHVVPVIPPELRPLVPLDGGRFATSDLNELYRRVIIRNSRLKKLLEIKAPEVILRNEKRMLQEAVDALFDNSRRSNMIKSDSNRPLKSLSDSLKGKKGRFRQNLLGKRVDYSARSVIVVGPELKMHECGLPKDMAAELYKPFVIRKLLDRGIVKTVKSAKKIVDRRDPVIWDILENVLKGHPVLLNRAPTLHRLGIQAFQPKLIEGKAIQLHPLACTAFNADFDGDQMAVHLPLGNEAILEAQLLMLGSQNILNPANGDPITVPSQDMVLGLYYITKERPLPEGKRMRSFYSMEEAIIAFNEKAVHMHDPVMLNYKGELIKTTMGRIIFNQYVPEEIGYVNQLLKKGTLRQIIGRVLKATSISRTSQFLDDIKNLGYLMAFKGGLSFNLDDVIIPEQKANIVHAGQEDVEAYEEQRQMGLMSETERYNSVINRWSEANEELTKAVMTRLEGDQGGFNSVYMMLDSGARGSREQIRQLCGMRGLMAKPQKSGTTAKATIENPILANFKEGLSVLEYFISTHGARKGLADTALKTADAGYLTRRLVDVAQDVIVTEEDCGTLRGLTARYVKGNNQDEATAWEDFKGRLLGRVALVDVVDESTGAVIVRGGEELTDAVCDAIAAAKIRQIEIRSVLTCEAKRGVCVKCYGRNLATSKLVQKGETVGIIAAQSIGEPGTQLTLRTFHQGGVASGGAESAKIVSQNAGRVEFEELRTLKVNDETGEEQLVVISRSTMMSLNDLRTGLQLESYQVPYGAHLFVENGAEVEEGTKICAWDPLSTSMISEVGGKVEFNGIVKDVTYTLEENVETDSSTRVIIDTRDRTMNPVVRIVDDEGTILKTYDMPVGARLQVEDGQQVQPGSIVAKMDRVVAGGGGDITGGLPRVTELFEARNTSNPATVSEIDGVVQIRQKVKRGMREVVVTNTKLGDTRSYSISISKQLLVQDGDSVRAGMPLSDGAITPSDILAVEGLTAVQEYIVNEVQDVYRAQGVKINDKHFEVIVRQMMRKVKVVDSGDTHFLEQDIVDRSEFNAENDWIFDKKYVQNSGGSELFKAGQIVSARELRDENSSLRRRDLPLVEARDARPATADQVLQGITSAALQTHSFMSAASFQETTKVLNDAALRAKEDNLEGVKENVICGHLIPAGTGLPDFQKLTVRRAPDQIEEEVKAKIEAVRRSRGEK